MFRQTGPLLISPLLANIYLHYVFDLWAHQWRKRHALGPMILTRYADDIVVGFDKAYDAKRFQTALRKRMEQFPLSLHPDKTRLIAFGRFAALDRAQRGLGKPETFNLLGFTHICGRSQQGGFQLIRKSHRDRVQARLREIKENCGGVCTIRFHSKGNGCAKWWEASSPTMRFRPIAKV